MPSSLIRSVRQVTFVGLPTVQDRVHRIISFDPHVGETLTRFLRRNVGPGILGKLTVPVESHVHVHRNLPRQISSSLTFLVGIDTNHTLCR